MLLYIVVVWEYIYIYYICHCGVCCVLPDDVAPLRCVATASMNIHRCYLEVDDRQIKGNLDSRHRQSRHIASPLLILYYTLNSNKVALVTHSLDHIHSILPIHCIWIIHSFNKPTRIKLSSVYYTHTHHIRSTTESIITSVVLILIRTKRTYRSTLSEEYKYCN